MGIIIGYIYHVSKKCNNLFNNILVIFKSFLMYIIIRLCPCISPAIQNMNSNESYGTFFIIQRYAVSIFRCIMKVVGPIMLFTANLLIMVIVITYLIYIMPRLFQYSILYGLTNFCIGLFLLINVEFNYALCAFTPAGTPKRIEDPGEYFGYVQRIVDGRVVHYINCRLDIAPAVSYRYCKYCKCIKPPRSHHCSISGKCILNMDHFCPWMNNCVGYYNYRYFVLFLIYLSFGCIYIMILTLPLFFTLHRNRMTFMKSFSEETMIITSFTLALSAFISVSLLLIWHVYLSLTNQVLLLLIEFIILFIFNNFLKTTIEFYINLEEGREARLNNKTFKNPYDKGWRRNLRRVFGDVPLHKALLLSLRLPPEPEYSFLPTADMIENLQVSKV